MTSDSNKLKRDKIKKIFKRTTEIIAVVLVVFLIGAVISVFVQKAQGKEPSVFGLRIYYILTDSMEPNIKVGDLILCKSFDGDRETLKKDDIVTFIEDDGALAGQPITHRIQKAPYEENGTWYIVTKGDNAPSADNPTPISDVRSVYSRNMPVLTFIYKIISNIFGFIFIIVLPLLALLVLQVIRLVKSSNATDKKSQDDADLDAAAKDSGFSKEEIEAMMELLKKEKESEEKGAEPTEESANGVSAENLQEEISQSDRPEEEKTANNQSENIEE